jgi:hypothetical protein
MASAALVTHGTVAAGPTETSRPSDCHRASEDATLANHWAARPAPLEVRAALGVSPNVQPLVPLEASQITG